MEIFYTHHNKVREYPNFISKNSLPKLIEYLNKNDGDDENWGSLCFPWYWEQIGGDPEKKPVYFEDIGPDNIWEIRNKINETVSSIYGDVELQIMKGHKHPKGSLTKPSAYYNVAAILFLNDDFDGGQFIMPNHQISLKPKAGSLYVFEEGEHDLYGVDEVLSGTRYSITSTWTFAGIDFGMFQWKDAGRGR